MASELIDSIFDIDKISKEVNDITKSLEGLKSVISTYSTDVKKLYDSARGAKSQDELSNVSKNLNDTLVQGSKVTSEYIKQQEKLKAAQEKLNVINSDANKELIRINLTTQERNALLKAEAVLNDKNAGTLEKLAAQNKILAIEKKKLNIETAEGKKRLDEIIAAENENNKALKVGYNEEQKRTASIGEYKKQIGELFQGFTKGEIGTKQLASGFANLGKQMIVSFVTNPIFLALGSIVLLIKGVVSAFKESEERTNKMKEAFARFQPIVRTIGEAFEFVADAVIKSVEWFGKAIASVTEFLGINPKGSADEFVKAEKMKQGAILETRKLNEDASNQEAIIAEQREIIADKENYSYEQRVEALKIAGEAEKKLSADRQKIAEMNLAALEAEAALDDNNAEMNDKLSAAIVAVNTARKESADVGRKLAKEQQKLSRENAADMKAEADAATAAAKQKEDAAKETARNLIEASRRLTDSQFALMEEGEAKQIALSQENLKRKLEDLQANGQLTTELEKNLTAANGIEIQKIRDDFAKQKADKDLADFEKSIADYEKNLQKEIDLLSVGYKEKETELKKQFANGKIDREKYEADLLKIQNEAGIEANKKTIELLQKELEIANLTADKKAEISNKIKDLQIENENAVLDATIEANEKAVEDEKSKGQKILAIAMKLADAAMDLFSSIADFQKQESEKRIQELEAEQKKNDETFEARQENLDKALMSDGNRADAQKKLDEDKARRDKEIADKVKAEKIKQAKWDKAQAYSSAIIGTAKAVIEAWGLGPILGPIMAVVAGIAGAFQIAKIASQQIPAYEKGGVTGKGYALWGEKRPEVAVTTTGQIMYAENPTISKFDAGTRIYKSVEDFERNMIATNQKDFKFDYDKMASIMPETTINLDANGLWGIVNKHNERAILINRRYKIGR